MTEVVKVEPELTEQEAAAMMGLSVHSLRTYRVRGTGIPYIKRGHRISYRVEDVQEYVKGKLIRPRAG